MAARLTNIRQRFRAMKDLLDPPLGADAQPLEIRAAVLDAIEKKVAVRGINDRAFPYGAIAVRLLPSPAADKAALEGVFAGFETRVRTRLAELGCDLPRAFAAAVSIVRKPPAGWLEGQRFSVEYTAADDSAAAIRPTAAPVIPAIKVTIVKGSAAKKIYTFDQRIVTIGRTAEVRDTNGRTRWNQVAFDTQTSTVSRAHATVKYDAARGEYRVLDDGSARGTAVVRDGTIIPVPRDPRGVRLRSDDEIRFGDAAVRVTIELRQPR
jgi:FHA domain